MMLQDGQSKSKGGEKEGEDDTVGAGAGTAEGGTSGGKSGVMMVGAAARRDGWKYLIVEVTWRSHAEYKRRQQQMATSNSIAEESESDEDDSMSDDGSVEGAEEAGDDEHVEGDGLMVVVLQVLSPEVTPLPPPPSSLAPSPSSAEHGYSSWVIERSFEALEAAAERWQVVFKEVLYS
jgi:hypothetical protein